MDLYTNQLKDQKNPVCFSDYQKSQRYHVNNWSLEAPISNRNTNGWLNSLVGCMQPILSLITNKQFFAENEQIKSENWEISFDLISDLEWLGSGAQGAVFSGKFNNEVVAIKKVRDVKETDIKHLKKLNHENIVKFK